MFCNACVAAPFSKLSIVTTITALMPLECTPNPPTAIPWRPLILLTSGVSPVTVINFSPSKRSWNKARNSRELKDCARGTLIVWVMPWNLCRLVYSKRQHICTYHAPTWGMKATSQFRWWLISRSWLRRLYVRLVTEYLHFQLTYGQSKSKVSSYLSKHWHRS